MHLLKTDTYEVVYVSGKPPRYAILSHRWEHEEITFKTINSGALQDASLNSFNKGLRASAAKIRGACAVAQQQQFDYVWIDTCCIDKDSSEELRTALNSMFKWYRESAVCYTFLNDVTFTNPGEKMFSSDHENRQGKSSEWFERGWTLQELLAPQRMEFYDKHWTLMGTRGDLATIVGRVAGITPDYLKDAQSGRRSFREASIAAKMSWMAGRTTRDIEDIAYSLLGIFNVNLTPRYGEGTKAFTRLQEAIMADYGSFDESLFAWERPQDRALWCYRNDMAVPKFEHQKWGLLAPSPDCFRHSGDIVIIQRKLEQRLAGGFQKTNQGIFLTLPIKEIQHWYGGARSEIILPLNCWILQHDQAHTVILNLSRDSRRAWCRTQFNRLSIQRGAKVGNNRVLGFDQGAVGSASITVPQPQIDLE